MKILFFSNSIGGLISFRWELITKLRADGHEVGICSPLEVPASRFEELGCKVFPIEMSRHGSNPIQEFKTIGEYRKVLREFKPDVCSAYTIKPNIYGSIAAKKEGVPLIASVTGLGSAIENGGIMEKVSVALLKYSMSKADWVYFQNQESIDYFIRKKIRMANHSLVAGSGVNLERFKLSPYPESDKEIHFLYTGRILEAKGVGLYLNAAKKLKSKYPHAVFHIVGIKDDEKYSAMTEEFHKNGIVIFHGQQSDVTPFIRMSHCQVHPTYYPEGMSNVLLESAAMGRPAITTDRSGCKEIVDDGETGFIIPQNDQAALEDALERFILLPHEQKEKLGRQAHEKVARNFNREDIVNEYIAKLFSLGVKQNHIRH